MPIEGLDYFVQVIPFPLPVPAFVHLNSDNSYTIFINANLNSERQMEGFEHELKHIMNDDFFGDKDIRDLEPQYGDAS